MLADYVEVDPQFEKPAEEFLHEELEYVVVESWQQAERGLDFIRAELDGRATFLVHPEPNGNGHRHLPEPAIGPETGIAARLSDSLRLTNGFKDRAVDLLPRVSLCFLAEDRAAAQRLAVSYPHLYFLLPDGVCYHGHTVTGGKKSGAGPLAMKREARELAATLQRPPGGASMNRWRGSTACTQEIIGLEAELERLRALQQSREKDRVALDHDMRKLGDDLARAPIRASRWRAWSWTVCAAMPKNRPASASTTAPPSRRRSGCAPSAKRPSKPSGRSWRSWKARPPPSGKSTPPRAPSWRAWKSAIAASAPPWRAWSSSSAKPPRRRNAIAPEIERLGEPRARLLADNIELDRQVGRTGRRDRRPGSARQRDGHRRMPTCAKPCAPARKSSRRCAPAARRCQREALADRSRPGAQAGRAEVPRRDQPQGAELPGGANWPPPTIRCPMPTPSPKPSKPPTRCATASKRSAR